MRSDFSVTDPDVKDTLRNVLATPEFARLDPLARLGKEEWAPLHAEVIAVARPKRPEDIRW